MIIISIIIIIIIIIIIVIIIIVIIIIFINNKDLFYIFWKTFRFLKSLRDFQFYIYLLILFTAPENLPTSSPIFDWPPENPPPL